MVPQAGEPQRQATSAFARFPPDSVRMTLPREWKAIACGNLATHQRNRSLLGPFLPGTAERGVGKGGAKLGCSLDSFLGALLSLV
jgi:hypothetical protein